MDIALVFPKSTFLIDPMVYPPLGLWYLAAQLESQGHQTEFFDLSVDEMPSDGDFSQMWVSATSPQMHEVRKIGDIVREWKHTKSVLGGAGPWANPEVCKDLGFNTIAIGESDHPDSVRQLVEGTGMFLYGTHKDIEWVIPPVRRWMHKYHAQLEDREGRCHDTATMFTSRGCPMACAFCESGRNGVIWDRFVRYESLDIVERQIAEIERYGYTGIMFYDDILPLNKPRTLQILDVLKKYRMTWRCFLRTDVIIKQGGFEYLNQMADSGLVEVLAGVESADNRIKNNIHKGTTIEQDTQVLEWCKELDIKFKASVIFGLPGEDQDSMNRTRDWILEYRPDRVDANVLIPFPGTPITTHSDEYDVFWTEELPEEFWYKGPRDEANALVGTSHLTPDQIKAFRDDLIKDLEREGIPY